MNIREQFELIEDKILSPLAVRSADSRGRIYPIEPCEIRTSFQRDRDRIIHAKAFRRLKQKTQVFISPEGDHYRTRLTHTLEVAQIARTISRALRLNEDLTEAIALGHDLGHTPFGHAGEYALNRLMAEGFRHNEQSLRVVDLLEGSSGLNLTWEVRDGILRHTGDVEPQTLEGMVVRISDRIAYINHDIDDSVRAGIISRKDLPKECVNILGEEHRIRIDSMVRNVINNSENRLQINMSTEVAKATQELREFLFERVYLGDKARREEKKVHFIIDKIYELVMEQPDLVGMEIGKSVGEMERTAADFVAGMTDRYALRFFNTHFLPWPHSELNQGGEEYDTGI